MGKHFCFVHCADLHLGEPFEGLRSGDKGPWTEAISKATFTAFERVVDTALEARADAILISGDVYNSADHSLAAQMAFARELYRAAQGGIETFIIHGNHDPGDAWKADIPLPPSAHVFSSDHVESFPIMKEGDVAATVYGISYGQNHIKDDVVKEFVRKPGDGFAIAMMHTDMAGAGSPYIPCTIDELRSQGMDYWALGHVHTRRVAGEKPYIVYPGNTQGLSINETGPRGCYLVDVGAYGTVNLKFVETDAVRWMDMPVDITGVTDQEEMLRQILKRRAALKDLTGRPNIVRLIFTGRGPLHKAVASEEGQEFILQFLNEKEQFRHIFTYFSRIEDRTKPDMDLAERRELPDVTGDFLRAYDKVALLPEEEKLRTLRELAASRPETARIGQVLSRLPDEVVLKAFERAETAGADLLAEEDGNEDH